MWRLHTSRWFPMLCLMALGGGSLAVWPAHAQLGQADPPCATLPTVTGPAVFDVFSVQVPTGYALFPTGDLAIRSARWSAWVGPDSSAFVLTWSKPGEAIAIHFDDDGSAEHEPRCTLGLLGKLVTLRLARQTLPNGVVAYSAEGVLELPGGVLHVNLMTRTLDRRKELLWALARTTRL